MKDSNNATKTTNYNWKDHTKSRAAEQKVLNANHTFVKPKNLIADKQEEKYKY